MISFIKCTKVLMVGDSDSLSNSMPNSLDVMKQADEAHEIEASKIQDNRRLESQDLGDWALWTLFLHLRRFNSS